MEVYISVVISLRQHHIGDKPRVVAEMQFLKTPPCYMKKPEAASLKTQSYILEVLLQFAIARQSQQTQHC